MLLHLSTTRIDIMGFNSGSKMFYSVTGLSFDDLCTILRCQSTLFQRIATIHFNYSWLALKLNTASASPVPSILAITCQFCKARINVVLVLDNRSYRHYLKKASIVCDRKAEQSRINSIILCQILILKIL